MDTAIFGSHFRLPGSLLAVVRDHMLSVAWFRAPDVVIGGAESPYLNRWHITPRGDGPATYLHQFLRDDDDRALHDHPWESVGIILHGGYVEKMPHGTDALREPGDMIYRRADHRHRVVLHRDEAGQPIPAWTVFFVGYRVRQWGFWCPRADGTERFVHWRDFTTGPNGETVGKGCEA